MATFTFNRRRTVDQIVSVEAPSLKEAFVKAQKGYFDEASDDEIVRVTLRLVRD